MAYTLAFRMVGNRPDAEEIIQEAFINAYKKLGAFRRDSSFSTWFYRIVYNRTISFLRSRKNTNNADDYILQTRISDEPDYLEFEERDFRKNAVLWAISQLKPVERMIITLFYHENKSLKETGAVVGMNEDAVKMKLHRSRKKMKALLESKFQGEFVDVNF